MLAEQHDEWIEGRRYLGLEVITRARVAIKAAVRAAEDSNGQANAITEPGLPELEPAA